MAKTYVTIALLVLIGVLTYRLYYVWSMPKDQTPGV